MVFEDCQPNKQTFKLSNRKSTNSSRAHSQSAPNQRKRTGTKFNAWQHKRDERNQRNQPTRVSSWQAECRRQMNLEEKKVFSFQKLQTLLKPTNEVSPPWLLGVTRLITYPTTIAWKLYPSLSFLQDKKTIERDGVFIWLYRVLRQSHSQGVYFNI